VAGLGWAGPARCKAAMCRPSISGREQTVTGAPASVMGPAGVVFGEDDVQVTTAQVGDGTGTVAFGDAGAYRGMGAGELAQGRCDQRAHDALEGGQAHRAGHPPGALGEVTFGLAELRGDPFAVSGEEPASRGQRHLPAGTVNEAGASLPFERAQLLRYRWRGQVQCLRSRGDAAAGGDRLEHAQPSRVDHAEGLLSVAGR
jgi:hypothetical protein